MARERTGSGEQVTENSGRQKPVITRPVESTYSYRVSCVVKRSSYRSIMLRQEELAFIKATSMLQLSPALLKELKLAMSHRKKPALPAGSRSTTSGSGATASQQLAGKCKANELASSGNLMEPANRRPAPGAGSAPLLSAAGNSGHPREG